MSNPLEVWHSLLQPEVELSAPFAAELTERMRRTKLVFGDRINCPFIRPFFLDEDDERRVKQVAETIAKLGERVVKTAMGSPPLLAQLALNEEEQRLVRMEPGYGTASTASRLDAFLLPGSLQFAEYNAESPAGSGYTELLAELFESLPVMDRFKASYDVRAYPLAETLLDALLASYRDWGGTARPPLICIVDFKEVPTWSEFQILRERFEKMGVPTVVSDPRDLVFDGGALTVQGRRIDLVYRRVLINDIVERPAECDALVRAYEARAVCVANTFRCKIPHKKAFFAVLTEHRNRELFSEAERALIAEHIPWTRLVRDERSDHQGEPVDLLEYVRTHRESLVIKPNDDYGGHGVALGWEKSAAEWDGVIQHAIGDDQAWVVQERIKVRREPFAGLAGTKVEGIRDMLVDLAPYLFRGRLAGFLTRLSSTGLANVTSGGGQVPSFVVKERKQ